MPFSSPQMQRRWKSLPGEPVGDAGDTYTGYDRFGRVERMRWGKLGDGGSFSPLVDVSWGHSPASQKTWRKDSLAPASTAQDQKFDYDALYQLTQRQRGVLNVNLTSAGGVPAQQEDFAYDETGNWKGYRQQASGASVIEQSRVNNRSNQITQVDGSSAGISYDKNGNMLTVPSGEALTNPSHRIVWDGWNRPVKVYDSADNLIAEYRYDGLGRRITVTSGGVTRYTYYDDQWRSIEERLDASTTPERQHVWHPNDRWEMILRDRSTANNGVMDERLYPLKDQLDPVALADDSGNVVERFSYTAFGISTFLNADFTPKDGNVSGFLCDFLFHAEFQDAETGWFNYGYRYYASVMGRWLLRDPIGENGGTNLYGMCYNSSVNLYDYLGLDPVVIAGGTSVKDPKGHDKSGWNFLNTAVRKALSLEKDIKKSGKKEEVVLVIYTPSYERRATAEGKAADYYLNIARTAVNGKGIKVVEIKSSAELTSKLDKMPDASISSMDYFGHSNATDIFLEYSSTPQSNGTHDTAGMPLATAVSPHSIDTWGPDDAKKVSKSRFALGATVSSYGCNQGDPGGFAEVINKIWGVASKGSVGKTDYSKAGAGGGPEYPDSDGGYKTFPKP